MRVVLVAALLVLAACQPMIAQPAEQADAAQPVAVVGDQSGQQDPGLEASARMDDETRYELATFAGGCFWCMEPPYEQLPGVVRVISGYAGGQEESPTYQQVSSGSTGHRESVQITFDPEVISYGDLLDIYWRQIDPTDEGGSFVDRGFQYTSAIFVHDEAQRAEAEASKEILEESGWFEDPIVTPIIDFTTFYPAEDYHQDYYARNAVRYKFYRHGSGRDQFIDAHWDDFPGTLDPTLEEEEGEYVRPSDEELREMLTPLQWKVTQEDGTERAFDNEYWDEHRDGIFVDRVSGEPLFSSRDKYESGTGWPSFTQPLEPANIITREDNTLLSRRTEVRSRHGDSHLGHVFDDGPQPTGLRYCMNSAALRFIPVEDLEAQGYGEYADLFE